MQLRGGACVNAHDTAEGGRVGEEEVGPRAQVWGALPR